jgi:hypothetical protein
MSRGGFTPSPPRSSGSRPSCHSSARLTSTCRVARVAALARWAPRAPECCLGRSVVQCHGRSRPPVWGDRRPRQAMPCLSLGCRRPCLWHPVPGGMGHGVKIQGEGGLGCARSSPRTLASRWSFYIAPTLPSMNPNPAESGLASTALLWTPRGARRRCAARTRARSCTPFLCTVAFRGCSLGMRATLPSGRISAGKGTHVATSRSIHIFEFVLRCTCIT